MCRLRAGTLPKRRGRPSKATKELIKNGVSPAQVATVGRGETMPKADNGTKEGKAANRRSDVVADPDMAPLLQITKQ